MKFLILLALATVALSLIIPNPIAIVENVKAEIEKAKAEGEALKKVKGVKRQAPTAADIKAAIAESGVDVEAVNIY